MDRAPTLFTKQIFFATKLPVLILKAFDLGYDVTLGECWRSDETARLNQQEHKGISNSLHRLRLAVDLNLFKDGKFLSKTEDYEPLGVFWESLSEEGFPCAWGGRFGDADHFSVSHNGVK